MKLSLPLSVITVHFIADWLLQTNKMALNKAKSNEALTRHVLTYSACFAPWGFEFACAIFVTHWVTDWITSRLGAKLWFIELGEPYATNLFDWAKVDMRKRKWFWNMIGLDQWIHYATLTILYNIYFGG